MTIRIVSPTKAILEGFEGYNKTVLAQHLSYKDKKVDYELKRLKNSQYALQQLEVELGSPEAVLERLAHMKDQIKKSLLFEEDGVMWTYSGLAPRLAEAFNDQIVDEVVYPEPKPLPWLNQPTKNPRPYQLKAKDELLAERHGAVEMGTGLGKSFILQILFKALGLRTVIMAPSVSIARQLHKEIEFHFGKKKTGLYGDGKKDFKKQIVIALGQSLTRVEEGSEAWQHLSQAEVFIADESHMTPAKTLQNVCFGLLKNAPYRFFFSGTQMRNDGLDVVLEGITGPIVYRMSVKEGVDQGYLAKPLFTVFEVESKDQYWSRDSNALTRAHLFYNPTVLRMAGNITTKAVDMLKRPTLLLIEEVEQFTQLLPHLRHEVGFAHGPLDKKNMGKVPAAYQNSDTAKLVDAFNAGKLKVLVGTSCVATGTDLQAPSQMIYLRGGASEIEVKQGVGRCTRLTEGKTDCNVVDFDVTNIEALHRHAEMRKAFYEEIYGPVRTIEMPK